MPSLTTSCVSLSGGATAASGTGEDTFFTFAGTWAIGDKWTVVFTDSQTGTITQVGAGTVSGIKPTFVFTFRDKVWVLAGTTVYFSALKQPTVFNDPNGIGNGYIQFADFLASVQNTLAISNYQGRLAFVARDNIQIWVIDPDPTQNQQVQTLENIGTFAKESVKSIGDLDVLFLADSGFRSLRVRDQSLNGFIVDLGSPIDLLVHTNLLAHTEAQNSTACGVVEPFTNRYWCCLNGTIYVLSYFPGSQVIAWSTYEPTCDDGRVSFTITSGSGNLVISAPYVNNSIHDISGSVPWNTSPTQTASDLANAVNNLSGTTGYSAVAVGAVLTLTPPAGCTTLYSLAVLHGVMSTRAQVQPTFVPQKFVTYNGQVYARSSDACYQYGGMDNNSYDGCVASWSTGYLSLKSPAVMKNSQSIGLAMTGTWQVFMGSDPQSDILGNPIWDGTQTTKTNTYDIGRLSTSKYGSHVKFAANTWGVGACLFSGIHMQYEGGDQR